MIITTNMTTTIPSAPAIAPIIIGRGKADLLSVVGCVVVGGLLLLMVLLGSDLLVMVLLGSELLLVVLLGCTVEGSGPPEESSAKGTLVILVQRCINIYIVVKFRFSH